ncbi:PAS domain-containing protein [Purpureocillium lilacinum]|uniref:Pas n=1 Tax=Purpureocillium lilacinum TaxID=33203 RepID=A0A179HVF4_PURLI|nr:PAS domain-containing protein [Purpureocillium lilacinum]KAK4093257.1 hypothetical protein Purlil1_2414 [Purpureocillium lilacinum]OAQ78716.1 PAS domain-containing protein [Purpureocillium lilacinum]OAQ93541.1 PAS domain-containing protein [Purpureocillium lilacinum]PWI76408.1 pas [Purpureocillium lilacinum]GJN71970.1 hypothetical protein PLICBS_006041 [Purpureocillium lilacinum]
MASKAPPPMNPWEVQALDYQFPTQSAGDNDNGAAAAPRGSWRELEDPVIYPGLYSATGYDMMSILLRIMCRPNPQIELGAVDCSVALILCNLDLPDQPIVYASDSFCDLTGYSMSEVIGRNCRFLQTPGGVKPSRASACTDKSSIQRMRRAIRSRQEIQLKVKNFKKNGQRFNNALSIIPIDLDSTGMRYAVGFQVEVD